MMSDESNDTATMNSVEAAWEMSSIKTLVGENNSTVEMNSLGSTCEMDTLNTQDATCEMDTLNTQGATCEMNTVGATCEMNALNIEGTTCEMNTQGETCEMNTQGETCEMNTQGETCEMSTLNTEGTTCDVNALENIDQCDDTVEMNIVGSTSKINTVEVVVDEGSKTGSVNNKGSAASGSVSSIKNSLKMTVSEDSVDGPPSKKIRLEINEPASDSSTISPQSAKDTVDDPSCKKIRLEINEPASDSSTISPQSAKDTVDDPSCKKIRLELNEPASDSCKKIRLEINEPASDSSTITSQSAKDTVHDPSCKKIRLEINEPASDSSTITSQSTKDTVADPSSKKIRLEINEPASDSSTITPQSAKDTVDDPSCKKIRLELNEPASDSSTISSQSAKDSVADPPCKKKQLELNEPASDSSTITPQSSKETVADPSCKKIRLELNEPASDSSTISPQSAKDTVKNSAKKDKVSESNDAQPVGPGEDNDSACKPRVAAAQSSTKQGSFEKLSPLTEIQAGITEYLGSHKGFSAIIKQRYSDFIVNEIDLQGNVVHLTQMNLENLDEEPVAESKQEDKKITADVISDEDIAKLDDLVKNEDKKASVNIIAPPDKEARTKIHLAVKKAYTQLETKTAEVDGQKVIQVIWKSGKSRGNNRDDWPEAKKDFKYVKFILYKENKDTMDAIGLIASNLKLKENLFQYAGTKDKRAKTSQEITAHRIHPKKLSFMNKVLRNIGLGNFQFVKEPLKLGQLMGNQFTIVLRNVLANSETVDDAISSLKTLGFVNYFGMQRFGTTSVPTHKVGCALLHSDWEKAVDLILMPRDDNPSKDAFQKVWMETRDPVATLKVTPPYCGLERNLLEALKRQMKPLNALEKISRNTRLLYIHSYQALVWNKMVCKRLKVFGMKPIVGDLAIKDNYENTEKKSPVVVTQDNLDQFSIHDVVLPLPGHDVIYPKNDIHSWYRETLAEDGLDIDNMKRPQKDYSLPGAYRPMTVCPSNVSWSHHRYDDCSLPLTLSDMDVIKEVTLPASHKKGKFKAVILKMNLPSSCYATMALREVLRVDTSVAHQTSLNVT